MTMTSISLTKDTVVLLSNVEYYFIFHSKEEAINQFLNYGILECNSEFQADDWFSYLENVNPGEETMISYDQCVLLSDKFKFEHKEKDALVVFIRERDRQSKTILIGFMEEKIFLLRNKS